MTKLELENKVAELEAKIMVLETKLIYTVQVPVYYTIYQQVPYYPQIYYTYQPQYLGGMTAGGLTQCPTL